MITIKEFPNKIFATADEAMKELIANRKTLILAKKGEKKECDPVYFSEVLHARKEGAEKAEDVNLEDANSIQIIAVANACNYYDSHGDVSIQGSWNRTAKNTKDGLHLQEHKMQFDKVISDDVTYKIEEKTWKELGYDYEGKTECIVMYSKAEKETNPYMFDKYVRGKVKNHSAGLRYVNMVLAVNNSADWAKEEKENWDKYYPGIVNKDEVDERGYFWAILEQKMIETSAVLRGSNPATPTISVEPADSTSTKEDPADATPNEADILQQKKNYLLNL